MANMKLIDKVTVGSGGAATIEFTSIPQTYTDLVIKISGRFSVDSASAFLRYNGTTTNGNSIWLEGSGSAASSSTDGSNQYGPVHGIVNSTKTASVFGNAEIYIPNYTSSNNKSSSSDGVTENNGTATTMALGANLWSNTAAITSIQIVPAAGGNFVQYSTAYLYGVTSAGAGAKATGGIITSDDNYFYHTFTSSGTFTPTQSLTADYLVVAGGGGGGRSDAGGGGAGGLRSTVGATGGGGSLESPLSLSATGYTVTIGAGGAGASSAGRGSDGSNSVFSSITSIGGGAGGGGSSGGTSGGSGGGASGAGSAGTGTPNQGYAGGGGGGSQGGGGGAGEAGSTTIGSQGGDGVAISALATTTGTGVNSYYAGGGANYQSGGTGKGGLGGGADGTGASGTANTGGGGGGWDGSTSGGGSGGSGIVIVRYAR